MSPPQALRAHGGFLRSARVVSLATLLSRVLGLVRDAAMAHLLGAGAVHDALTFAWTVPNAFRRLFGEGALSTAFVPVFSRVLEGRGLPAAAQLTRQLVSFLGLFLLLASATLAAAVALVPDNWLAAVFGAEQLDKAHLTVRYVQLLLPYLAIICVIAQFMAVLNALGSFAVPAMAPVILNLVWITGVGAAAWWSAGQPPGFERAAGQGYVVVAAILVAAVLQFVWHLPALASRGVPFHPVLPRLSAELREVGAAMLPMLVGMGAAQVNLMVDRSVALVALPDGGATHLYYGLRIQQFPMGLVTVALATTAFPAMARLMARQDKHGTVATAGLALATNLLVSVPAMVGLLLLSRPIVELLFRSGQFDESAALLTADALSGYAWGIPFAGTVMLLQRACYAANDTRLPMRVGVGMVLVNLVLDLVLVGPLGGLGLALATSLSALVSTVWLVWGIRPHLPKGGSAALIQGVLPTLWVSLLLALCVWGVDQLVEPVLAPGRAAAALRVGAGSLAGLLAIAVLAPRLCPKEWIGLSSLWRRAPVDEDLSQ